MDVLRAEIAKKRKMLAESNVLGEKKKYFKRIDLLAVEEEEYIRRSEAEGSDVEIIPEEPKQNPSFLLQLQELSDHATLSRKEVIRRLRDRGEPILFFGESELESFQRMRHSEISEPEVNRGFRNDFQEAMDQVDRNFLDQIIEKQHGGPGPSTSSGLGLDLATGGESITYEEIQSRATRLGKGNREYDVQIIYQFLQLLLKIWENQLNSRPDEEKHTRKGKLATATFTQTQIYLKPLFRKLRIKSLPEDIADSLVEIVGYLLNRNYIKANDSYLQMAIGNSPWPIGVTMVGIHARTGREKIFSKNVAHVLNDETQRKYIQALKRLMTKCQQFFPADPSKCVEYAAFGPLP